MKVNMLFALLTATVIAACGGDGADRGGNTAYVYDSEMLVGCDYEGNVSLQESSEQLFAMGVDVLSSSCAYLTNISLTESCGDLSGEFYIHEVRPESLVDIGGSKYRDIEELNNHDFPDRYKIGDGGVGYTIASCGR